MLPAALAALALGGVQPSLPPLPRAWPRSFQLGVADAPGGAAALRRSAPFRFRYQYLAGGVNTGRGWATWDAGGSFASTYADDSRAHGAIPVFSYYMLLQSEPDLGDEARTDLAHLRDPALMRKVDDDLALVFRRVRGRGPVVLHVEPDLWGYVEQASRGDDARTVPGAAAFARRVVALRNRLAPNVLLAWHLSVWGTKHDLTYEDGVANGYVDGLARRAARFYRSLGARFDVVFTDASDRDAGFKEAIYGDGGASWWDAGDFARFARFWSTFVHASRKRLVVWQIPLGNTRMRAMDDTWGHYQDNRVQWWLDDPSRAHLRSLLRAGVVALLFGGGAEGTTCACDARHDGVTNPAPVNGNTQPSLSADDDGGFFRDRAAAYYRRGALRVR